MTKSRKGFTLIEILIAVGIIAILAAIVIIAINPARQFQRARDAQRWSDVNAILNSVHQRMVDNKGSFAEGTTCDALPAAASYITSTVAAGNVDLCDCLVTTYLAALPFDPSTSGAGFTDCSNYTTGYTVMQAATGRITVAAPGDELDTITVTR
ncbi:prepilin-type N-terminal cleavage/methylation domain-containing protein [Patescibacteria group bacterium]|nr:prepilin-type N-terminal cleavage/methylation domain-containing protein [Patescibacteria group bacterium]